MPDRYIATTYFNSQLGTRHAVRDTVAEENVVYTDDEGLAKRIARTLNLNTDDGASIRDAIAGSVDEPPAPAVRSYHVTHTQTTRSIYSVTAESPEHARRAFVEEGIGTLISAESVDGTIEVEDDADAIIAP